MQSINSLSDLKSQISKEEIKTLIKLIAPLAPYMAEEMWSKVREENDAVSVHLSDWPQVDENYLIEEEISLSQWRLMEKYGVS